MNRLTELHQLVHRPRFRLVLCSDWNFTFSCLSLKLIGQIIFPASFCQMHLIYRWLTEMLCVWWQKTQCVTVVLLRAGDNYQRVQVQSYSEFTWRCVSESFSNEMSQCDTRILQFVITTHETCDCVLTVVIFRQTETTCALVSVEFPTLTTRGKTDWKIKMLSL